MAHYDAIRQEIDRGRNNAALPVDRRHFEEIRRIENNFQARTADLVDQAPRLIGRIHHVSEFRFNAEIDAVSVRDADGRLHGYEEIAPGVGLVVVGVTSPLVLRISRARAERDQSYRRCSAGSGKGLEASVTLEA